MQNTKLCLATTNWANALIAAIARALVGLDERVAVDLLPLQGAVAATALAADASALDCGVDRSVSDRWAVAGFEAAYLKSVHENRLFLGRRMYPLLLDRIADTPERAFFADMPAFPDREYGTLRQALAMASWNAVNARSAACAVWFLDSQVGGADLKANKTLRACVEAAVSRLLYQAALFDRDELHLALLIGDAEVLELLRSRVAAEHFRKDQSVMQLFESNGRLASYSTEAEQNFRQEIVMSLTNPIVKEFSDV